MKKGFRVVLTCIGQLYLIVRLSPRVVSVNLQHKAPLALAPDTLQQTAKKSPRRQPYLTPIAPKSRKNSISEEAEGPKDSADSLFKVLSLPEALVQVKITKL